MKIEKDKCEAIPVAEIECGECFSLDGAVYMVTDEDRTVCLSDGEMHDFHGDTMVCPIYAKVVIK